MASSNLSDLAPLLEERLGLKPGFLEALDGEDESDWAFIVKVHALIEAAVSYLLTEHLARPELNELFARLDMSNKKTGKTAFCAALNLLEKSERRFVSEFSELRNKLVHDVRQVSFDLPTYVGGMDEQARHSFVKSFNLFSTELTDDVQKLFHVDPRQAIWYSSMAFLGLVYLKIKTNAHH